ncbi:MAG TPA: hypothetical protein VFQ68_11890 [Streptosporangiaceae bacterium]|nr:hypothetical protein [Streptosporangiaceae bacterium]
MQSQAVGVVAEQDAGAVVAQPGAAGLRADVTRVGRVVAPGSKLSTIAWWRDVTLGADLGIEHATTDEAYAAMDWLQGRQELIEKKLARRHLAPEANPSRMALFDLSSSWLEGSRCPLGARGYSRDGKKGNVQIEYGLLTDAEGRPVAIRAFEGNAGDPAAFTEIAGVVKNAFGLKRMVMVGDRGMITSARIRALRELDGDYAWITALRAPRDKEADGRRRPPAARRDLRHPHPAARSRARRRRHRDRLQEPQVRRARLPHDQIRRPRPAPRLPPPGKTRQGPRADLHARRLPHLAPAPGLGTADLHRRGTPQQASPVAPAQRSASAEAKASRQHDETGRPYRSFQGLLAHLGTLTRNELRLAGTPATVPVLAEPTSEQRQAFELIGAAIPLTLRK